MAAMERMAMAAPSLSAEEKGALIAWEKSHVTGDGSYGTSDWPGWPKIFSRMSH